MTPAPRTIGFDIPLEKDREMIHEHKIRHLPVLKGGKLVGILSERKFEQDRDVKRWWRFPYRWNFCAVFKALVE